MRNVGITNGRASLGASADAATTRDIYAPRGSILTGDTPLERSQISEASRNIIAVLFVFLFLSITGIGLAFALFVLTSVRI